MTSKNYIKDIQMFINEVYSDNEPLQENQIKSKQVFNDYCNKINQDLDRLEKAIDILKDKFELELINDELHLNTYECDTREIHALYDELFYKLTKEEFELLNEVLGNDK